MRHDILIGLLVFLVIGCGDPYSNSSKTARTGNEPTGSLPPPTATSPNHQSNADGHASVGDSASRAPMFDQALELWRNGDQEHATAVFLAIDEWTTSGLTSPSSVFAISEESFSSFPRSRQTEVTEQFTQAGQTIRQLARNVIAAAKDEADAGKAMGMLKQIESCGSWLRDPARLSVVQLFGQGMTMMAAKEIEQLSKE